jgi:hypothetical protein
MRAPYVAGSDFRFSITRRNVVRDLAVWLGAQDIELGDAEFDEAFVIKSNNEARMRQLLASQRLRDLLNTQRSLSLTVKDDEGWFGAKFPEGADELYFAVNGTIKELDRLKQLYDLFAETLDQLVRIGSAAPGAPAVTL